MDGQRSRAEDNIRIFKSFENQENTSKEEFRVSDGCAYVGFDKIRFKEAELVPKRVWMRIPSDFEIMDGPLAETKYPGEDRPDYIYANPAGTLNFCFSIDPGKIADREIALVRSALLHEMQRLYPASPIESGDTVNAYGKKVSYFSFTSPVLDGDLYNFMFFTENAGNLLIGTFNCVAFQKDDWTPVLPQVLETLRGAEDIAAGGRP
jgi:hypothetical protein